MSTLYGGIEAGGTKFVCAVAGDPESIVAETSFPTTMPAETIGRAIAFFQEQGKKAPLAAIGIASFGPIDIASASPTYGYITSTPKPGWHDTEFAGAVGRALGLPVAMDTDVNAAALGEHRWGAATDVEDVLYVTVGTGIGGGALAGGRLVHGLVHPEMGHMPVPHDWAADPYSGSCPYHGDCWEGLACGLALRGRWRRDPKALPPEHPAWPLEARYLGVGLAAIICVLSPKRIVLGGGVMKQPQLFPMVRAEARRALNGYIKSKALLDDIDRYIVPPGLGDRAGVMGAIALAQTAVG